jgi:hypothetical protein
MRAASRVSGWKIVCNLDGASRKHHVGRVFASITWGVYSQASRGACIRKHHVGRVFASITWGVYSQVVVNRASSSLSLVRVCTSRRCQTSPWLTSLEPARSEQSIFVRSSSSGPLSRCVADGTNGARSTVHVMLCKAFRLLPTCLRLCPVRFSWSGKHASTH